jgi:polysaccharide export outer membrane protein
MCNKCIATLVLAFAWAAMAQESASRGSGAVTSVPNESVPHKYVLTPDDEIVIHATNAAEISEKPIRLDGKGEFKMPLIGQVAAAGLTLEQLEVEVTKRLRKYLENPEVVVNLVTFHNQPVSIFGEVGTPGVHQAHGSITLIELLSMAGGLRPDAGPTARITRRLDQGQIPLPGATDDPSGKFSVAQVKLKGLLDATNPDLNILILPYDIVSVPAAEIVYVLGEVARTGPLGLKENGSISILEAVSSSGGVLRTAAPQHAKILRPVIGTTQRTEVAVDIKRILAGTANDVPLLPGDILFVPGSTGKKATLRAIEAAITAGTTIATYGVVR